MTITDMRSWIDYLCEELRIHSEDTLWGKRLDIPPECGQGFMEVIQRDGCLWIWNTDVTIEKELAAVYMPEKPCYISFNYWKRSPNYQNREINYSTEKEEEFHLEPGSTHQGVSVFFHVPYFERLTDTDITSFVESVQDYDNTLLMKRLSPVLQQILYSRHTGLAKKLFMESRVLELASVIVGVAAEERDGEDLALSDYDVAQLRRVPELLRSRMANPPKLTELARTVALNEYKLKAGFRKVFGTTIYEYLRLLRMEKAIELLLEKSLSVTEIALSVGYETAQGFSNAFRRYYGRTPTKWLAEQK